MRFLWAALAVLAVAAAGMLAPGLPGGPLVLDVVLPYAAAALFLGGMVWRVWSWARVPVPFRIPTTCGQQRSLTWIRPARLDNPATGAGAALRVLLEVVALRSLLRNTRAQLRPDGRVVYGSDKLLWLAAMAFHVSLGVIVLRHARFFLDPLPSLVQGVQGIDGFLAVGVPTVYLSTAAFVPALLVLLARRLADARLRYVSLAADYFPLLLLAGIAVTGVLLRHVSKTDLRAVKTLGVSLAAFAPVVPSDASPIFSAHLILVCTLAACFPFSKLVHMAGVFLSPTRNLPNDSRARRHVNPWNAPVPVHTYAEWEDEFRPKLKAAGIAVEKE
jgi:nitrate reductase gamma subunit